jgi:predicted amidohydrolase
MAFFNDYFIMNFSCFLLLNITLLFIIGYLDVRREIMARFAGVSSISFSTDTGEEPQKMKRAMNLWEDYIDTSALDKPDLILLPEIFLQNTAHSSSKEEKADKSDLLPEGGEITQFLSRKSKEHKTYIFASYWRKDEKGRGRYNSAILFDREGKVSGVYDKTFPTIGEMEDGTLPGKEAKIFQTDFGRIGAIICFDLNFHELLADYKNKGVELLCMLSIFRGGFMVPSSALRYQIFIATSTPGENSIIVDPLGRILAESSAYGRIIFAKINLDSQIAHIDYNQQRVADMKKKYQEYVKIEVASPEAVYFISSIHPEISVQDMIKEFEVETLDEYLDRARRERVKYLVKE